MRNEELDQIIEKSFRSEPDFHLPADFAQKVMSSVIHREQWKTDLNEYLYLTAGFFSLLAVVLGFYYWVDEEFLLKVLSFISGNVVPVIFLTFILNFILFTDRVLLRFLFRSLPRSVQRRGEETGLQ